MYSGLLLCGLTFWSLTVEKKSNNYSKHATIESNRSKGSSDSKVNKLSEESNSNMFSILNIGPSEWKIKVDPQYLQDQIKLYRIYSSFASGYKRFSSLIINEHDLPSGLIYNLLLTTEGQPRELARTIVITSYKDVTSFIDIVLINSGIEFKHVYERYVEYDVRTEFVFSKLETNDSPNAYVIFKGTMDDYIKSHILDYNMIDGEYKLEVTTTIMHLVCSNAISLPNCITKSSTNLYIGNRKEQKEFKITSYELDYDRLYLYYSGINIFYNYTQTHRIIIIESLKTECTSIDLMQLLKKNSNNFCFYSISKFTRSVYQDETMAQLNLKQFLSYNKIALDVCFSALVEVCAHEICYYTSKYTNICQKLPLRSTIITIKILSLFFGTLFFIFQVRSLVLNIVSTNRSRKLINTRTKIAEFKNKTKVQILKKLNELSTKNKKPIAELNISYNNSYKYLRHCTPIDDEYIGSDEEEVLVQCVNNNEANYVQNQIIERNCIPFKDYIKFYHQLRANNYKKFKDIVDYVRSKDEPLSSYFIPPAKSTKLLTLPSVPSLKHRVILELCFYFPNDYVNAVHLSGIRGPGDYIITVCCCQIGAHHLFRMVMDYKIKTMINFCTSVKCAAAKCKLISYLRRPKEIESLLTYEDINVICKKYFEDNDLVIVDLKATRKNQVNKIEQSVEFRHFFCKNWDHSIYFNSPNIVFKLRKLVKSWHGQSKYPMALATEDGTGAGVIFAAYDYNICRFDIGLKSFNIIQYVIESRHARTNAIKDSREFQAIITLIYHTICSTPY